LKIIDTLAAEPSLKNYHLLPAVRGDFLVKLGRLAEAQDEFARAASLTSNARERELLLTRARKAQHGRPRRTSVPAAPSALMRQPILRCKNLRATSPACNRFAGGAACVTGVFNDGEFSKSNMSSSGFANSSRFVRCRVVPLIVRNRRSINASNEV